MSAGREVTAVVAGASGFIGTALCAELSRDMAVIGISRRSPEPQSKTPGHGLEWRQADLFSLLQVERAVKGATVGIYLVHSMQTNNRLTQGSFADIDMILADNFARAARKHGVQRIIYLSGIIPARAKDEALSPHLASRLEVERVLGSYGAEVITLRSGLVVGRDGSSFKILERLVERLPLMLCPRWTQTLGQPIALSDVVSALSAVAKDRDLPAGPYDVGGADVLSYVDMMRQTAKAKRLRRLFLTTRLFTPTLSRLWVSLITGKQRALIYPLIESLRHQMLASDDRLMQRYGLVPKGFTAALAEALTPPAKAAVPAAGVTSVAHAEAPSGPTVANTVCSIQRVQVPAGRGVTWAAQTYSRWLPRFLAPLVRVDVDDQGSMRFYLQPLGIAWRAILALQLIYNKERSDQTRSLFYITGGLLSDNREGKTPGRFEFRQVPGQAEVVIAILNFQPRLPWWFYVQTQARVHLFVMRCFKLVTRRLAEQSRSGRRSLPDSPPPKEEP